MKRWAAALVVVIVLAFNAPAASAGPPTRRPSGYAVRVIYQYKGRTTSRITYPGYVQGFPPPALFYYGYPHSGNSYGTGF